MSDRPLALLVRLGRVLRRRAARADDEGGFILLETMIALSLITVVMAAVSVQYVNGVVLSGHQRSIATASQVATSAMSDLRAVDPASLLSGRDKAAVIAQRTRLTSIPKVSTGGWISGDATRLAYSDAGGAVNVASTAKTETVGTDTFRVDRYLECVGAATEVKNTDGSIREAICGANDVRTAVRAVVVVGWDDRGCPPAGCAFVSATLIDAHANPTFDLNQPLPSAPLIDGPGNQVLAVDDVVSLQLKAQDDAGVAPFFWAVKSGSLPPGLTLSPSGMVSGTVAGPAGTYTTVIRLTDGFGRFVDTDPAVTWTVNAPLALQRPIDQSASVGKAIAPLTLKATGGSGTGYTFSDPAKSLPAGLTLNASTGQITGTPTAVGTSTVTLTVTDSTGKRSASTTFPWNVTVPPLKVTSPGDRTLTKGVSVTGLAVTASDGAKPYTYGAGSTLPSGLSLNASGGITGTPTTVGVKNVKVEVTDKGGAKETVSFTLTVVDPSTVSPTTQQTTVGGSVTPFSINPTCRNAPCTYKIENAPAGNVAVDAEGRVTGSLTAAAKTVDPVTVSVKDASDAVTTATFRWVVVPAPTLTNPGPQQVVANADASIPLASYASGGTPTADGRYTWTLESAPSWLSIDPQTGTLSGRAPNNASTTSSVRVSLRDSSNVASQAQTFSVSVTTLRWTCTSGSMSRTVKRGSSVPSIDLSSCVSGGNPFVYFFFYPYYSFATSGLPQGLAVSGDPVNGYRVSGTVASTAAARAYPVDVTATDRDGNVVTITITITVTT